MSEPTMYEFGDDKFVFEPEIEIGDFGCVIDDDNGNTVSFIGKEPRHLYKVLDDYFGDGNDSNDDDGDSGPATELLDSIYYSSMNTRPIDELFENYGRVMAENDRSHNRVVTMSDVDAEVQSLCERVMALEKQS